MQYMTAAPLQQQLSQNQVWGAPEVLVQSLLMRGTRLQAQLGQVLQAAGCGQGEALRCAQDYQHETHQVALGAVQLGGHTIVKRGQTCPTP